MAFPRRSSRTPRSRFTLGLLLLTAVTLLALDLPGTGPLDPVRGAAAAVFRPVRSLGDAIFEPFANGWKGAFGYDDVKRENDELKAELDKVESQDDVIAQLEAENAQKDEALGIKTGDEPAKVAQVTTGPLNSFDRAIEIDVGKDDGIRKGMAVATDGGLLGRIDEVEGGTSTVELITESSSWVGVRLTDGTLGSLRGQGPGEPLLFELLGDVTSSAYEKVRKGAVITTSGIDRSAFPGGLIVGKVSSIGKADGSAPPTVEVEPSADLDLVYVKVILKDPPK